MTSTITPIDKKRHQNTRIKVNKDFYQAKGRHMIPLVITEFAGAAQEYPVVFVKDADTGLFRSVAVTGLKPGENLFYSDQGWLGSYVPQTLQTYPFLVSKTDEQSDNYILCFDTSCQLINESEGHPLFDEKGEESEFVKSQADRTLALVDNHQRTQAFINVLLDNKLLEARSLKVRLDQEKDYELTGYYVINEQALNELSDEAFNKLRKTGYLAPIYASLLSMNRIHHLIHKKMTG